MKRPFSQYFPLHVEPNNAPTHFAKQLINMLHDKPGYEFAHLLPAVTSNVGKKLSTIRLVGAKPIHAGAWEQPYYWSGIPYRSKHHNFCPPIRVEKVLEMHVMSMPERISKISITEPNYIYNPLVEIKISRYVPYATYAPALVHLANANGLTAEQFVRWFDLKKSATYNIIIYDWANWLNKI